MTSWGDELKSYVKDRETAPPLEPIKRFLRRDGGRSKAEGRDVDIITCHTKPDAPVSSAPELTRRMGRGPPGSRDYDIVTMVPATAGSAPEVPTKGAGKRIEYRPMPAVDMITHQTWEGTTAPPLDKRASGRKPPTSLPTRQTNIISHQFRVNDAERSAKEREDLRRAVEERCKIDRELNPVTQQFNDAMREEMSRRDKVKDEARVRELVRTHTYDTSGIVKRSEGHAFDIVTNHVYNPQMVLALDKRSTTGLLQRAQLRQQWEHQRDVEEAVRVQDVDRSLKRISQQRLVEGSKGRGYDILSNAASDTAVVPKKTVVEVAQQKLEPRVAVITDLVRSDGPRPTQERLFHQTTAQAAASTYAGRRQLLLPTVDKVLSASQGAH